MMNHLTTSFPFMLSGNTALYVTAEAGGHPLVFAVPLDALCEAASAAENLQPLNAPPHPFGPITTAMSLLAALPQLAEGVPVADDAPVQAALARWGDFCIDAAMFIVERGVAPERLFPRLWSRAESELEDVGPEQLDSTWAVRLQDLQPADLERLAPGGFCREREVVLTREMPDRAIGVTFHRKQMVLVLRQADTGLFLWPECPSTADEVEAFTWPWETHDAPVVMVLARGLTDDEISLLRKRGAARS